MEHSDWLVFGWDFTVWIITMEMVPFCIFPLSQEIQVQGNTKSFKKASFNFFSTTVRLYNIVIILLLLEN